MEANEAPEKIYLDADENWHRTHTAYTEKAKGNDIEYIRADAFMEKACEYLMDYEFNDSPTIADRRKRVDKFIKYMKGE